MAVEGEFAWPRCIGCNAKMLKKKRGDVRYGMDVCCKRCIESVYLAPDTDTRRLSFLATNGARTFDDFRKMDAQGVPPTEERWHALAEARALTWAKLRDHFQMAPFPAGLELFMVEVHNVRNLRAR